MSRIEQAAIDRRREDLQREINSNNIVPISFEVFKKNAESKVQLKKAKARHKEMLRKRGF